MCIPDSRRVAGLFVPGSRRADYQVAHWGLLAPCCVAMEAGTAIGVVEPLALQSGTGV